MDTRLMTLALDRIAVDSSLQPRVGGLDTAHVQALQDVADSWPPLVVTPQGARYVLIDGFHRYAAAQNLGLDTVPVQAMTAPEDGDLLALAFALNAVHGRPLSLADRRAFAERFLGQHPHVSNMEVSRRAGLSPTTIATIRERLEASAAIQPVEQRVGAGGYTYTVATSPGERQPGELPDAGLVEQVGDALGRLFTSEERRQQRRITHFLQRLAVALEDQEGIDGWERTGAAADACRLVLGDDRATALGEQLGWTSRNVLDVAVALGYQDEG